jgi:arylsulfatase A
MKKIINFTVALLTVAAPLFTQAAADKPNIIIVFNDDMGYRDLSCFNAPKIKTPRVDQMANDGMKFTDFYVASPVCSASRASLMTGCYHNRVGVRGVFFPNRGHVGLDPKHVTIAEVLKTVGYKTKAVGKWHLGDEKEFLPTNQGFDSYYGIPYSNDMTPAKSMEYAVDCLFREGFSLEKVTSAFKKSSTANKNFRKNFKNKVPLMRDEKCIELPVDQRTITQRFATEGIKFISESVKKNQPFFLYLANSMPHIPLYVSPEFEGKSNDGLYGDVIEEIDYNFGRILDHLKKLKIEDNTLVVFTSDNGPWLVKGDQAGSALPLFEGKMTHFEGGQRVPTIIKWPGKVPVGSVCREMALSMDLLPTLAHITGAALPTQLSLDGKNIIDLVTGKKEAKTPHEYFFFGTSAVRSGHWKYHAVERFKVKATARKNNGPTLYNLHDDIGESKNVIAQYPEIAQRLKKALESNPNKVPAPQKKKRHLQKK